MARNLRALITKNSMKERFKTAQTYLPKIKFLIDDVSLIHFSHNTCQFIHNEIINFFSVAATRVT